MAHPVPKDLKEMKEEERLLSIKMFDLYLTKTGAIYNASVSIISGLIFKLTGNIIVFLILFIASNIAVYPLAQTKTKINEFDGGNIRTDKFLLKKYKYKFKKRIYLKI